jgi:hypothetical protein
MRRIGLLSASLLACVPAAASAETDPGYVWMGGSGDGNFSLTYGSPETAEDELFWIVCRNGENKTELVVYVDMKDVKLGQTVAIELSAGNAKAIVKGAVATDEMSGFLFAKAEQFPIKPVIELLASTGPVTVKTGAIVTKLPDKGRRPELAKFTKGCKLN